MRELVGPRRALAQQRRCTGLVEGVDHHVLGQRGDGHQDVDFHRLANDRCDRQHGVGGLAQPAQAPADDFAYTFGDTQLSDLEVGGPHAVTLDQASRFDEREQDLLDEERVAFGFGPEQLRQLRDAEVHAVSGGVGHELSDAGHVQSAQSEALDGAITAQVSQDLAQRMAAIEVGVAVGTRPTSRRMGSGERTT